MPWYKMKFISQRGVHLTKFISDAKLYQMMMGLCNYQEIQD